MNNEILCILASLENSLLKDLAPEANLSTKRKDYSRAIINLYLERRLGLEYKTNFSQEGLSFRTTPINKGNLVSVEAMRLCSLNLKSLTTEEWESSELHSCLGGFLILPLIVEAKNLGQPYRRVGKPVVWIPSDVEIQAIKADWLLFKEYSIKGAVPAQRGVKSSHLTYPTEASTNFVHIKPHSVKGKFELDAFGNKVRRMAFYLNPPRLRHLLLKDR